MSSEQKAKVVIERTYKASVKDVWELWTTKEGFESWWGPQGFRADVSQMDARVGGTLCYAMIADTPEMIAAMKAAAQPTAHGVTCSFTELKPRERLVIKSIIDFIPGVPAYDAHMEVDLIPAGDRVRMVVTLDAMHSDEFTEMQKQGFTSQLTKLDKLAA